MHDFKVDFGEWRCEQFFCRGLEAFIYWVLKGLKGFLGAWKHKMHV